MSTRNLSALLAACAYLLLANAASADTPILVRVVYLKRPCESSPDTAFAPVTAGTIVLHRATAPSISATLSSSPPTPVMLNGQGPLFASMVLETPRIKLVEGATNNVAQTISLGKAREENGIATFVVGSDPDVVTPSDSGHVNVLVELDRAARIAGQAASPVHSNPFADFGSSARAFGHPGAGGVAGFVDPDRRLAIGYLPNKPYMRPGTGERGPRLTRAILEAIG